MGFYSKISMCTKRYVKIDLKYLSHLGTDIVLTISTAVAFGALGYVIGGGAGYDQIELAQFYIIGVFFWALWNRAYDDTARNVLDESSKGCVGLLVTNDVRIHELLIGRWIASTLKGIIIAIFGVAPIFILLGVLDVTMFTDPVVLVPLLLVFLMSWFFMLGATLLISSLSLIIKKSELLANIFLTLLKIASGYYFPITKLPYGLSAIALGVPISSGLQMVRDIMIGRGTTGWTIAGYMPTFYQYFTTLVVGTVIFIFISWILLSWFEKLSRRWGTIEFY